MTWRNGAIGRQSRRTETDLSQPGIYPFPGNADDFRHFPDAEGHRYPALGHPKSAYEKIGYARPVVLDRNGAWEAVLENAYDIIVTSEINGEDTFL